jgi:hypothetical protein
MIIANPPALLCDHAHTFRASPPNQTASCARIDTHVCMYGYNYYLCPWVTCSLILSNYIWRTGEVDQSGVNESQSKFLEGTWPISQNQLKVPLF